MTEAVVKGTIAVVGPHEYSGDTEIKTAKELKAAAIRQPSIMLTLGHPGNNPKVSDYIGRVDQTWNEEEQRVDGVFSFYDDHWLDIPQNIRGKIIGGGKIPISAGISVVEIVDGEQKGILYDHIAILRDGENPICPLDKCGINMRREMQELSKKRYEQQSEIGGESTEPSPESAQPEASSEVDGLKAEIAALKAQFTEITAAREPAVEEKTPEEPAQVEPAEEPAPVPEMVVPAGVTKPPHRWTENESGHIEIIPKPKKSV